MRFLSRGEATSAISWFRRQPREAQFFLLLGLTGILLRLALTLASDGSTDFKLWEFFGRYLSKYSLTEGYSHLDGTMKHESGYTPVFNHPPLPSLLAVLWFKLAALTGIRFSIWLKLPGLTMECVTGYLVGRIWTERRGATAGAKAWAAYGWSLCSILVSGYHGNTDAACAGFSLLAIYLAATGERDFWAGLALGAAINVKVIPLLLILPLLAHYRSAKPAGRFLGGLAIGALPFVPFLLTVPRELFRNIFTYVPASDFWGVQAFLLTSFGTPRLGPWAKEASVSYMWLGRALITVSILALSAAIRLQRTPRWSRYESGVLALGAFMLLIPGFGVQYVILVCPVFFAVSVGWGSAWAWLTGIMLSIVYFSPWTPRFPWASYFKGRMPFPAPFFGVLAWSLLGTWMIATLSRRERARE